MSRETMPVIAGNAQLLADLTQRRRQNRLPHALLLHGQHGCGKKMLAKWFAMLVLCEHAENAPCGQCKSCQLILADAHPDVQTAQHSGKRMGFSVETVRQVRRDAAVIPNSGSMRVFLFPDADGMSIQAQNALLKSVEEPPAHACFVFTAETAGVLLPTLLSRMTACAVYPVTQDACRTVLQSRGYAQNDIEKSVSRFDGNIGKCIAYLEDDAVRQTADTAAALSGALAKQDEYEMLRLLTGAAADKDNLRRTLSLLDAQIRDAACLNLNGAFTQLGCDRAAADALAKRLSPARAVMMHDAIADAFADLDGNVGAVLTVTALCAALF